MFEILAQDIDAAKTIVTNGGVLGSIIVILFGAVAAMFLMFWRRDSKRMSDQDAWVSTTMTTTIQENTTSNHDVASSNRELKEAIKDLQMESRSTKEGMQNACRHPSN